MDVQAMRYDLFETNYYCSITHISVGADVNLIMQCKAKQSSL